MKKSWIDGGQTADGTESYVGAPIRGDVPAWLAHPLVRRALALDPALVDDPDQRPFLDSVRRTLEATAADRSAGGE